MHSKSWILFFLLFILIFILAVLYFSEIRKELLVIEHVNAWMMLGAIGCQSATYLFTALNYRSLLGLFQSTGLPGLGGLIKASVISLLFNQTVPSAGISGNTFFFFFLSDFNISRSNIISLILTELLVFYAAMEMMIISLALTCMFYYHNYLTATSTLVIGFIVYFVFGIIIKTISKNDGIEKIAARLKKVRIMQKAIKHITSLIPDAETIQNEPESSPPMRKQMPFIANAFGFQLLLIAADALTLYVLFLGVAYPVSYFVVLLSLICTKIISIIPFLPGSLILYESSMSFFFIQAGIPAGTAVIVTLTYRLLSYWLPMPFGAVFYRKWLSGRQAVVTDDH